MHGGKSPRGAAHPQFRHGKYSKALPANLRGAYERAINDKELFSLREEAALVTARQHELVQRLSTGEADSLWTQLRDTFKSLEVAVRQQDADRLQEVLPRLKQIIENGVESGKVWKELFSAIDKKTSLAGAEERRLVAMSQMLSAERVVAMMSALVDVVRRHVKDQVVLDAIGKEVEGLMVHPGNEDRRPLLIEADVADTPEGDEDGEEEAGRSEPGDD